MSFRWVNKY